MAALARLDRTTLQEMAPRSVAILPLGSQEQHGEHLPMGTDTFLVEAALDRAIPLCTAEVVRLPPLSFGFSAPHQFAAALSLQPTTLLSVLEDLVDSLVQMGFRRILFANGHGGNTEMMQQASKLAVLRAPIVVGCSNFWEVAPDKVTGVGHAGTFETDLMMAAHPDLVFGAGDGPLEVPLAVESSPPGLQVQRFGEWDRIGGTTDAAHSPDAQVGRDQLDVLGAGLAEVIDALAQIELPEAAPGGEQIVADQAPAQAEAEPQRQAAPATVARTPKAQPIQPVLSRGVFGSRDRSTASASR